MNSAVEFFDANSGTYKPKGQKLKSAVEVVTQAAPPPTPPPPVAELPFEPLTADVAARRACSGTTELQSVYHVLRNELAAEFAELSLYDADADEIARLRDEGHAALKRATELLHQKRHLAGEVRDTLVGLAETRRQVDTETAALADAKQRLADPSCLSMDAAALFRLSKLAELKPATIAELQSKADDLAKQAKALLAKSNIDGQKLLAHMKASADYNGKPHLQDGHVHSLFQQGYMRLPT